MGGLEGAVGNNLEGLAEGVESFNGRKKNSGADRRRQARQAAKACGTGAGGANQTRACGRCGDQEPLFASISLSSFSPFTQTCHYISSSFNRSSSTSVSMLPTWSLVTL